jgi:hypothetical protein
MPKNRIDTNSINAMAVEILVGVSCRRTESGPFFYVSFPRGRPVECIFRVAFRERGIMHAESGRQRTKNAVM